MGCKGLLKNRRDGKMATRYFALIFGIIYGLVGVMGFIPGLLTPPGAGDPALALDAMHGHLLGIFPVNILHSIVHLLTGLAGILAARTFVGARAYCRVVAIVYALLVVMGLIAGLNTTFGLIPLYGNDVWLHVLVAGSNAIFGWLVPDRRAEPLADTSTRSVP
jgi:hypothetical protein